MSGRSWQRPGGAEWQAWFRFLLVFYAGFFPAYFLPPLLAGPDAFVPAFAWELAMPRLEWAVLAYLSIVPAFLVPLFLMTADDIRRLGPASVLCSAIAALFFLFLPTRMGYPNDQGTEGTLVDLIRAIDVQGNLFPSLHVAFGTLIVIACARRATRRIQAALFTWLFAMSISTLLTHQHHVVDLAGGALLGVASWRLCRPAQTPPQPGKD